jgi:hypothetical protein
MGSVSPRSDLPIPGLPRRFPVSCAFRRAPPPSVVLIRVPDASAQLPKPVTAVVPAYPHDRSPTPCSSSASPVKVRRIQSPLPLPFSRCKAKMNTWPSFCRMGLWDSRRSSAGRREVQESGPQRSRAGRQAVQAGSHGPCDVPAAIACVLLLPLLRVRCCSAAACTMVCQRLFCYVYVVSAMVYLMLAICRVQN